MVPFLLMARMRQHAARTPVSSITRMQVAVIARMSAYSLKRSRKGS